MAEQGWPPSSQAPGYGQPSPARPPETEGTAIAALVLSIASFVVLPVIPAIVALVLCSSAERKIRGSGGTLTGESLVKASRIVAWINIGLAAVAVVVLVGVFLLVVAAAS